MPTTPYIAKTIGDDWDFRVRWTAGSPPAPVALGGFIVRGYLYHAYSSQPVVLAAVIADQEDEDGVGWFTITFPKAVTGTFKPDPHGTFGTSLSIQVTDPAGLTRTYAKVPIKAAAPRFAETFNGIPEPQPEEPATIPGQLVFGASTLTVTADGLVTIFSIAAQGPMGDVTPAAVAARDTAVEAASTATTKAAQASASASAAASSAQAAAGSEAAAAGSASSAANSASQAVTARNTATTKADEAAASASASSASAIAAAGSAGAADDDRVAAEAAAALATTRANTANAAATTATQKAGEAAGSASGASSSAAQAVTAMTAAQTARQDVETAVAQAGGARDEAVAASTALYAGFGALSGFAPDKTALDANTTWYIGQILTGPDKGIWARSTPMNTATAWAKVSTATIPSLNDDLVAEVAARVAIARQVDANPGWRLQDDVGFVMAEMVGNRLAFGRTSHTDLTAEVAAADVFISGGITTVLEDIPGVVEQYRDELGFIAGEVRSDGPGNGIYGGEEDDLDAPLPAAPVYPEGAIVKDTFVPEDACLCIVGDGQSHIVGSGADESDVIVASTPKYPEYVFMPPGGVRLLNDAPFDTVVPLKEQVYVQWKETIASGLMNHLEQMVIETLGAPRTMAMMISGDPGEPYQTLGPGSVRYRNMLAGMRSMVAAMKKRGKRVIFWFWTIQGDANTETHWPARMRQIDQWARYKDADARRISGQTEPALNFITPVGTGRTTDMMSTSHDFPGPVIAPAMFKDHPLIRVGNPIFGFPHSTDNIHLTCLGQNLQGQSAARTVYAEVSGQGWTDFKPYNWVWESTTVGVMEIATPTGADLVIDDGGPIADTVQSVKGFQIYPRGGPIMKTTAAFDIAVRDAVAGGNKRRLAFTFTSPVTGPLRIAYATRSEATGNGPVTGARGLIADAVQHESLYVPGTFQRNRMIPFVMDVPGPA